MGQSTFTTKDGAVLTFTDADVLNAQEDDNTYIIWAEFGTLAVVRAMNENDALDEAADRGKLKGYKIKAAEARKREGDELDYLGNHGEPYDLTYVRVARIPSPRFSFCALFNAHQEETAREIERRRKKVSSTG